MTSSSQDILATAHDNGEPGPAFEMQPKVGRYLLLDRLGVGGMGTVFLAHDPELDRKVAIKLMRGGASQQSQLRMQREAQAMAQLSHVNVAAVFDVGWFGKEIFMAMEYLAGGTLADWLEQRERGWREILDLFLAAGQGLAAAHALGLIHRDFKPANVLLSLEGVPKVTDFGLVRSTRSSVVDTQSDDAPHPESEDLATEAVPPDHASGSLEVDSSSPPPRAQESGLGGLSSSTQLSSSTLGSALDMQLTMAGSAVGTPAYMAPEQFRGADVDARSDQFSFCVALHHALWGSYPFAGDDIRSRLRNVVNNRRTPRPSERDVPDWLIPIIDRGLRGKQSERWPSMAELLAALADDPATRRRSRRRWALAGGFGLALVAGVWGQQHLVETRCAEAGDAASRVWLERADTLEAAVRSSGPAYAEANIERVHAGVDEWIARWARARTSTCDGSSNDASASLASERCLDGQLGALSSLLTVFDERAGAPGVAAQAITAVAGLPDPAACSNPRYAASHDQGCTPELELAVHRLRALELAGLYTEGLEAAELLLANPALRACPGLEDQTSIRAGRLELEAQTGKLKLAESRSLRALRRANKRDELELARAGALSLSAIEAERSRLEAAATWLELADLYTDRLGAHPAEVVEVQLARANILHRSGDYEHERIVLRELHELMLDTLGERHPSYLRYLEQVGLLEQNADHPDDARAAYEQAASMAEQLYGPDHPRLIEILLVLAPLEADPELKLSKAREVLVKSEAAYGREHNKSVIAAEYVGLVMLMNNDNAVATEHYVEVIERYRALPNPPPRDFARALGHYGIALRRVRRLEQAQTVMRESLERFEAELGPEHPELGGPLINLANAVEELGGVAEAVGLLRRALAIYERSDNQRSVALLLDNMGMLELELGQHAAALRDIERAATLGRALFPAESTRNIDYITDLALAEAANGRLVQARARFDELRELCDRHPKPDNIECAYTRGMIARFLLDHAGDQPHGQDGEAALALTLSQRAAAHANATRSPIDALTLRFIHARALAATGDRARATRECTDLLEALDAHAGERRGQRLTRTIETWLEGA